MNAQLVADYGAQADFVRSTIDASQVLVENAEAQKAAALAMLGDCIRRVDDLLAEARDPEIQAYPGFSAGLAMLHETRTRALAFIAAHAPDEAYLWTPEMQARIRQSEADIAAGRSHVFMDEAELEAFFQEQGANV